MDGMSLDELLVSENAIQLSMLNNELFHIDWTVFEMIGAGIAMSV